MTVCRIYRNCKKKKIGNNKTLYDLYQNRILNKKLINIFTLSQNWTKIFFIDSTSGLVKNIYFVSLLEQMSKVCFD